MIVSSLRRRVDGLFRCSSTPFGMVSLWVVLALTAYACTKLSLTTGGEFGSTSSVLGVLSVDMARSAELFMWGKWLFYVSAGLWAGHLLTPLSSWVATISFTVVASIWFEHVVAAEDHTQHIYVWLLFVYALWTHFYSGALRQARRERRLLASRLYPRWVLVLSVFSVAWLHTLAGSSKLIESGPAWVNGTSLQIWVNLWGFHDFWMARLILDSRTFAALAQLGSILIETSAVVAVFDRRLRVAVGVLLISFHIVNESLFGFQFTHFIPLIVLFFLPVYELTEWLQGRMPIEGQTGEFKRRLRPHAP